MMKKWTCLVLTLLLAVVAACALAEYSGTWGDNITWALDDQGLLIISGEGPMADGSWYYGVFVRRSSKNW